MKKTIRAAFALLLTVTLFIGVFTAAGYAAVYDGKAKTDSGSFTWSFNSKTGALSVTGSGSVTDSGWTKYKDSVKTVSIGKSITEIGYAAFKGCKKLRSVTLADSVETIGKYAFANCGALENISFPDSVTKINAYAFLNCKALQKVTFPASLKSIADTAFKYAGNIDFTIPDSVVCIQKSIVPGTALADSPDPRENGVCYADRHVQGADEDISETVKIIDGTVSIAANSFLSRPSVRSVILPASVSHIGWNAFGGCCNLRKIAIPNPDCYIYDADCVIPSCADIYGVKGSTAEKYAKKYGMKFYPLECFDGHQSVLTKATPDNAGKQTKKCSVCGTALSQTIPQITSCKLSKETCICHNYGYRPSVTVKNANGTRLVLDSDYTLTYKNNVKIGVASVTVKFIGPKYSGTKTLNFRIIPANVYSLRTTARTDSTVSLKWSAVDGVSEYKIYEKDGDGYRQIASSRKNSCTVSGLRPGTEYIFFATAAKTVDGVEYESAEYMKIDTFTSPAAVQGFVSSGRSTDTITFSWEKTGGADGYRLYRYDAAAKKYIRTGSASGTSLTVKNLKAGKIYTRYIRAYKTLNGVTAFSPEYTKVRAATKTAAPSAPTLTAGTKKITAKWTKPSGATGMELYMKSGSAGTYKRVYYGTKTAFTKSSLKTGSTYYFKTRSYKTVDGVKIYSAYSTAKSIKAK